MTITLDATPGGSTANSYCTETEAIAYMANRLNASAWTTFSGTACTEDEKKALISATIELSMLSWVGRQSTTTQSLVWPRWAALNPDSPVGFLYPSDIVPDRVKNATIELAFQFLNAGPTDISAIDPSLAVIEKQVDVLVTRYQPYQRPQGLARFPSVMRFIRALLTSHANSTAIIRG